MTATRAQNHRPRLPSTGEHHEQWLGMLRPDGPFLALTTLLSAFPQGLETVSKQLRGELRQAWLEREAQPALANPSWQELVLARLLEYQPGVLARGTALDVEFPGFRPDAVAYGPGPSGRTPRLHLYLRPAKAPLTRPAEGAPALAERAAQLCRDTKVPLAVLSNGQFWVLVHAVAGEPTSVAIFDADLWWEEPDLLRAFATLLRAGRVLPPPTAPDGTATDSLAGLFVRSQAAQAQVTTTLGNQVKQAVELFIAELARLDRESAGELLRAVPERDIYRSALTVLMRLVFLLYAEEHRLLPVTDEVYANAYSVATLYNALQKDRDDHGEEISDRRKAAWPRLLALFTAIHDGCEHPDLRVPAYGGSLFDPRPHDWLAGALVSDRVVHHMLDALLVLQHGSGAERLSYAGLDVEQIGHVYEGLLEFSCLKVDEPHAGLIGKWESEIPVAELERMATEDQDTFHAWLRELTGLTKAKLDKALAAAPDPSALGNLGAACDNDQQLADRLLPFWGLLRLDLRELPMVFPTGSVLFTQVGDRRTTGTHYTPKKLADEVVEHTLAPLCFTPGPVDGVERKVWRAKTADELLRLKVVDPAMGSGAFLVAACRYLTDRVVEAWDRDGVPRAVAESLSRSDDRDGLALAARRLVAARCLYGVDRDDMAVELAKLSLWLVTLAKNKPFGFLDHALRCGDSLVGLVSEEQVKAIHLDARDGWTSRSHLLMPLRDRIDEVLSESAGLRRRIEATVVQDPRDAEEKAELLRRAESITANLRLAADAVAGAALSTAVRGGPWYEDNDHEEDLGDRIYGIAEDLKGLLTDNVDAQTHLNIRDTVQGWLRGHRDRSIRPFHWPVEFPEVFQDGGFDAVVGNPPFIGGQRLTSAIGADVREYLVRWIASGKRGSADLCSYFLLRNLQLSKQGRVGIIATNTIAQGDTREVGLDQVVSGGWNVYRAVKSQPWPGKASLEVSLVWVGHLGQSEAPNLDGRQVSGITPSLDPRSRTSGNPHRLVANAEQSFVGSYVHGPGFIMPPEEARLLIDRHPNNEEVLFPYLNGEDLNSRADCSAARWVINFRDWSLDEARKYRDCFEIVERDVKPDRARNPDRQRREIWWRFTRPTMELYEKISNLDRVLVIARVSKTGLPLFVSTRQVISDALVAFAVDRDAYLTLLSSNIHFAWWTTKGESTLRKDARYTPSDGFETFAQPKLTARMDQVGEELHTFRQGLMLGRQLGLTKLYNLVHDSSYHDDEIQRLREIHTEVDNAVAEAYGWTDLDLGHGFHETRQGLRFTIAPEVQVEVLDRLLELNHERYAEEVAKGLPGEKRKAKAKKAKAAPPVLADGLFPPDGALF
ncbi:Eco57I restriction-modification methylase domain-containing protein [Crossiella sp. NPDC003009]